MFRKDSIAIKEWIENSGKALLVTGARQTGKTWLIRDEIEKSSLKSFEINFIDQPDMVYYLNAEIHLIMTFMATVILKLMSDKLKNTSLTTASMFMNLHEQHAIIYDKEFITSEPVKKMNEAYEIFKIKCPVTIPR